MAATFTLPLFIWVKMKEILRELLLIVGFSAFVFGVYQVFSPAAFIAGGLLLMWLGAPAGTKTVKKGSK